MKAAIQIAGELLKDVGLYTETGVQAATGKGQVTDTGIMMHC